MKKIILAIEGNHFSAEAFSFIRHLNEKSPLLLTGAFLPYPDYSSFWGYAGSPASMYVAMPEASEDVAAAETIAAFEKQCRRYGIEHRVHVDDNDFALPGLKKETRFADLLIVASDHFYRERESGKANIYLKTVLHDMECPVLLLPEKYEFPSSIILTYDGSAAAVFAIKQFSYVLPELTGLPVMLLYAAENELNDFPHESYIKEFICRHFPNCTLYHLPLKHERDIATWLSEKPNSLVVTGGHGGSRLFHHSFLNDLLQKQNYPLFNARMSG